MTLTEFLLARIAEDEAEARVSDGYAPPPMGYWDNDRVLAECEAKRRIVEAHRQDGDRHWCMEGCGMRAGGPDWPCVTLALLALPYADHEDWREEWKP